PVARAAGWRTTRPRGPPAAPVRESPRGRAGLRAGGSPSSPGRGRRQGARLRAPRSTARGRAPRQRGRRVSARPIREPAGSAGAGVLRMTWKSRIVLLLDPRVRLEPAADGERTCALVPYPQHECLEAAVEQKARVRIQRPAKMIEPVRDPLDPRLRSNDRAG